MGEHSVPQYYLSGFCDPLSSSKIWVYEKGSKRIFQSNIKNIAVETNRWPQDIEEFLTNKIEAPANPVLGKIRSHQPISQNDKELLSAYMANMMQHVDRGLERTKEIAPKVADKIFDDLEQKILSDIEQDSSKKERLLAILQNIPNLKTKYLNDFPLEIWYKNLNPEVLPQVLAILPAMTWIFFVSEKGLPFLTSDNPLFFFEWQGIGKPESEVTFPISSEIVLWATWRKDLKKNQYVKQKEPIIREINRRIASSATKYVYYSLEADWVVRLINKKSWRLNRIA
jgi:hypothetical protein